MKKVFDQTYRDIRREVNKKVLKVPGIEQKVLDVTSNEPWGPHGSVMADIAHATRNYPEYQIIMSVLWKRLNDTGKNWRHVYKSLTVLDYLVGNGSERVIDDLREHAYQISTLSDFQYVDSHGKDQGQNVRKKAQAIVALINDKERIREVREKAAANRDKYRGASATGGMYRPSSYSSTGGGYRGDPYEEDRYGSRSGGREDDRNGYGREREWDRYRDDDRYGRNGDSYGKDGDRYGRDGGERYSRDGDRYRDDEYGGGKDNEEDRYGSRKGDRSYEKEKDQSYEDDDRYSSRNGGRTSDYGPEDRYERKLSGGKMGAPPSYEESVNDSVHRQSDERDGGSLAASVAKATTRQGTKSQGQDAPVIAENVESSTSVPSGSFDDFDPRNSFTAVPPAVTSPQMDFDLFGPPSEPLALPAPTSTVLPNSTSTNELSSAADLFGDANLGSSFTTTPAPSSHNQPSEDPFGESPFKVSSTSPQDPFSAQTDSSPVSAALSLSTENNTTFGTFSATAAPNANSAGSFGLSDAFQTGPPNPFGTVLPAQGAGPSNLYQLETHMQDSSQMQAPMQMQTQAQPVPMQMQTQVQPASMQMQALMQIQTLAQPAPTQMQTQVQPAPTLMQAPMQMQTQPQSVPMQMQAPPQMQAPMQMQAPPQMQTQPQPSAFEFAQPQSTHKMVSMKTPDQPITEVTQTQNVNTNTQGKSQQKKFEPKSAVWADTLSRGLVDLNISGPKINPLADIGIDLDSLNRLEKRREAKERSSAGSGTVSSSGLSMGKAMGSGTGLGRAGASVLSTPPPPMVNSMGMGMGMGTSGYGMGPISNMSMGAGMSMGMGMGMGMTMGPGTGMNPAMPGIGMRPPMSMPPAPGIGMNPMIGMGGYATQQQPYPGYR